MSIQSSRRAVLSCLSVVVWGSSVLPGVASALGLITCPLGTSQVSYSPGITNTPTPTKVSGVELSGLCTGLGLPVGVSSFTTSFAGTATLSCSGLFTMGEGEQTFVWNNGATSTWHYTATAPVIINGQRVITSTGVITSGLLTGMQVTQVLTLVNLDLMQCDSPGGLTTTSGPSTYTFTGL
ncbi:hypothetical protein MYSTI_00992 [Myxococcus stipitatus DSM 14675]|uniref:Uncharacterized protein n=1 Tax=Myxococcus stipitatus (strain DSM 14675 / JCM 12634 / Mx s8) TaxID=1278073 RepID=L7U0K7_MYXSD|nr:hypothetical protein MYSTI_00992 [Myxococcus stipitatus DSM 14675]